MTLAFRKKFGVLWVCTLAGIFTGFVVGVILLGNAGHAGGILLFWLMFLCGGTGLLIGLALATFRGLRGKTKS